MCNAAEGAARPLQAAVEEPRNAKSEQDPKPQKPLSLSPFSPGTGFGAAGWKPAIRPDAEI
jgi:hypothetical protein